MGKKGIVTGWGVTESGSYSGILLKVTIPILCLDKCIEVFGGTLAIIRGTNICAGVLEGGKDSCMGDSGGPMVDEDTNELIALVSWGLQECALPGYPAVYTRLTSYLKWINHTMVKNEDMEALHPSISQKREWTKWDFGRQANQTQKTTRKRAPPTGASRLGASILVLPTKLLLFMFLTILLG